MSSQPPPPPPPQQAPPTPPPAIVRPPIPFTRSAAAAAAAASAAATPAPSSLRVLPSSGGNPFRDVSCLGLACQSGVAGLALGAIASQLPFQGPHPRPPTLLSLQGLYMCLTFAGCQCLLSKHRPMPQHEHSYTAAAGVAAAAAAGAVEAAYAKAAQRMGRTLSFPLRTGPHTLQLAAFLGVAGFVYEQIGMGEPNETKRKS